MKRIRPMRSIITIGLVFSLVFAFSQVAYSIPQTKASAYPKEAVDAYCKAIELNEKLVASIDDPALSKALAQRLLSQGIDLKNSGNLVEAEKKLLLSGNFEQSAGLYKSLGECYFKQERWDAAALMYHKAIKKSGKDPELMGELARSYVRAGKRSVAIEMFCRAITIDDSVKSMIETKEIKEEIAERLVARSRTLSKQGKHIEAAKTLKIATALDPGPRLYFTVGESYLKANSETEAAKAFALSVEVDKSFSSKIPTQKMKKLTGRILFKRALGAYQEGVYDKAVELFTLSASLDRRGETFYNLADCAVRQKRTDDALKLYKETIKINPELSDAYINAAHIYISRKMPNQAIELLSELANRKPDIAQTYELMAGAFASIGKTEEAASCYKQAVDYDISLVDELKSRELRAIAADELYESAKNSYKNKRYEEAVMELKKASAFEEQGKYHFLEGNILFGQGKLNEALKSYESAARLEPGKPEVLNNLGNLYLKLARYDEAIIALKKATKLNPNYAQAFNNLGICLRKQGRVKEAIRAYKSALSINPEYAAALFNLGNAYSAAAKI